MTQKVVVKLQMNDPKSRTKAMKLAVGMPGVTSAALDGNDKDRLVVVGDGVDSVDLTTLLRKKMKYAELISVGEHKKEEKKPVSATEVVPTPWAYQYPPPLYYTYPVADTTDSCCIM